MHVFQFLETWVPWSLECWVWEFSIGVFQVCWAPRLARPAQAAPRSGSHLGLHVGGEVQCVPLQFCEGNGGVLQVVEKYLDLRGTGKTQAGLLGFLALLPSAEVPGLGSPLGHPLPALRLSGAASPPPAARAGVPIGGSRGRLRAEGWGAWGHLANLSRKLPTCSGLGFDGQPCLQTEL